MLFRRKFWGPFWPFFCFVLMAVLLFNTSRLGLSLWLADRVNAVSGWLPVFLNGLRIDTVLLSWVLIFPIAITLLLPDQPRVQRIWPKVLTFWFLLWLFIFVLMELSTPAYIAQYDQRPSRIFVEYLIYPREVFLTLWTAYKPQIFITVIISIAMLLLLPRKMMHLTQPAAAWSWSKRLFFLPIILSLLILGARSSLSHRPINPSSVAFSSDHLVNELSLNSTYSLLYAIDNMRDEKNAAKIYGIMEKNEILRRVRESTGLAAKQFISENNPTLHYQSASTKRTRPFNLVIILEESLGAQFVGALGGLPLTPELDRLSKQGWWFTNLYATGTRSVRGIEAIITGFLPTPARSVVKLGLSQTDFYTIARTLHHQGYHTEFIYGGEGHFDNMANFFLNNGFQAVYDEKDYPNPIFKGSWGVSDEDLFSKAHQLFLKHGDQPFFALIFSTSSHTPYQFPDGRIELYQQPKAQAYNAVKYADYVLGQFIKTAREAPYWKNTIFMIVADHDARVFGASLVPIEHFHIPGLILGPNIKPHQFNALASQIDLPPTLLSLIGVNDRHPMVGVDLTRVPPNYVGRAIMQYGDYHAYWQDSEIVIHPPHALPQQFTYKNKQLTPSKLNEELAQTALAHVLWPSLAYQERNYREAP